MTQTDEHNNTVRMFLGRIKRLQMSESSHRTRSAAHKESVSLIRRLMVVLTDVPSESVIW